MLRYASVFLKNIASQTLDALKSFKTIDIGKLIPAFMNVPKGRAMDEALIYVSEYCIKRRKSREKTVHNLAFYFFAEREKPYELLDYLMQEEMKKQEGHAIFFEIDYALNVCKQKERDLNEKLDQQRKNKKMNEKEETNVRNTLTSMKKAQIILYSILGLHDKSVKLALECDDIDMAKSYANKPQDKKLSKKLWMKIAKYLLQYTSKKSGGAASATSMLLKNSKFSSGLAATSAMRAPVDVTSALRILKDSPLKIDDLLPLFPEEAKVEDMKAHLC